MLAFDAAVPPGLDLDLLVEVAPLTRKAAARWSVEMPNDVPNSTMFGARTDRANM
jgi:hypothetical protein